MAEATTYLSFREDRYREFFRYGGASELLTNIYRDVYRDDYPEEASPFGFVTRRDLEWIADELRLSAGASLLDVGCGRGGPGMAVAQKLDARLTGIDIVAEAVALARQLQKRFRLRFAPVFAQGSFDRTGLPDESMDGVMSVDCFWMVLDKMAALGEVKRVMMPGAKLAMTTWVPSYLDMKSLLAGASLRLCHQEIAPLWMERQLRVYEQILKNRQELERELGADAIRVLVSESENAPAHLAETPRMRIVAERAS